MDENLWGSQRVWGKRGYCNMYIYEEYRGGGKEGGDAEYEDNGDEREAQWLCTFIDDLPGVVLDIAGSCASW